MTDENKTAKDYILGYKQGVRDTSDDLIWAAEKLVYVRTMFGNAPFTTNDLDRLFKILGSERFVKASEPNKTGIGVWSPD